MKRAVGRGLCAAAFLGLALLLAAPDAAAHTGGSALHNLTHPHHLDNPRIITSPASGDTYLPGETITVYVPWGRTLSGRCIQIHTVGTVELEMTVGGVTRTLTGRYQNRRDRYGSGFDGTWLYFDYVVQVGDRDTDGVSLAEDALSSPGTTGSSIRGVACGDFSTFELSKQLHGLSTQSGHKVDTPAPTFSGVTGPAVLFYAGASVNYRLPQVANAADAHNVSYSVTSAQPLPTGYTLNASTATITGSYGSASARQNYTLRATDGFNRTADLTFSLEVSGDAGIESISITSNPGADKTYGKVAPFGTNDTITVRVDFTHRLTTILGSRGVPEHPDREQHPPGVQPLLLHLGLQPLGQARFQLRGAGGRLGRRRHLLPDEPDGRRQGRRSPFPPHPSRLGQPGEPELRVDAGRREPQGARAADRAELRLDGEPGL